jgi:hypothetical protein
MTQIRKREIKEQSKLKLASSKLRTKQRVESCDDSSTSGVEPFQDLDFDPTHHVQKTFKPSTNMKSNGNGLFTCAKNTELIKSSNYTKFSDLEALEVGLIKTLNEQYGSNTYYASWTPNSKYVYVKCRAKGCPFSLWYKYEMAEETGLPINIVLERKTTISHHLTKHQSGVARTSS